MPELGNQSALKLEIYDRAVRDTRLTDLDRRVFWRIVDRMNADLTSWPSYQLLGAELMCARRSAMRSVEHLCALGLLSKVKGGGRGKSNLYRLKTETVTGETPNAEPPKTVTDPSRNGDWRRQRTVTKRSPESLKEPLKEPSRARAREAGAAPKGAPASAPADVAHVVARPVARDVVVLRSRHVRDRGIRFELDDDTPWRQLKGQVAARVGEDRVRTWLDPLLFIGLQGPIVRLGAPSETIRKYAFATLTAGAGEARQFDIVVSPKFSLRKER